MDTKVILTDFKVGDKDYSNLENFERSIYDSVSKCDNFKDASYKMGYEGFPEELFSEVIIPYEVGSTDLAICRNFTTNFRRNPDLEFEYDLMEGATFQDDYEIYPAVDISDERIVKNIDIGSDDLRFYDIQKLNDFFIKNSLEKVLNLEFFTLDVLMFLKECLSKEGYSDSFYAFAKEKLKKAIIIDDELSCIDTEERQAAYDEIMAMRE